LHLGLPIAFHAAMVLTLPARVGFAKSFRLRPNYGVTGRRAGGGAVGTVGAGLSLAENPLVKFRLSVGPVGKLSGWLTATDEIAGVIIPCAVKIVA